MLTIIANHYVTCSGLMWRSPMTDFPMSFNAFYYCFLGMFCYPAVNYFVMVSAYFMCESHITVRKFLKLYSQIAFYGIILYVIFVISGRREFACLDFLHSIVPVTQIDFDHFIDTFIVWWLLLPCQNALVHNITRKVHQFLIAVCLCLFCLYHYIPGCVIEVNSLCWYCTLFFIASYIRMYPDSIKKDKSISFWGIVSMLMVVLSMFIIFAIMYADNYMGKSISPTQMIYHHNSLPALMMTIPLFMFVKNLHIKSSKIINAIGATTFGVYLIHFECGSPSNHWLWTDIVDCVGHYAAPYYIVYSILSIISIFVVCSIIDFVRIHTLEKWFMKFVETHSKFCNRNCETK